MYNKCDSEISHIVSFGFREMVFLTDFYVECLGYKVRIIDNVYCSLRIDLLYLG